MQKQLKITLILIFKIDVCRSCIINDNILKRKLTTICKETQEKN